MIDSPVKYAYTETLCQQGWQTPVTEDAKRHLQTRRTNDDVGQGARAGGGWCARALCITQIHRIDRSPGRRYPDETVFFIVQFTHRRPATSM